MSIFASLAGTWMLSRSFEPGIGTMSGTATFTRVGEDELAYREDGRLVLATGYAGDAWREYRYLRDSATTIRVVLADTGVTMHTLDVTTGAAEDSHLCGADTYLGRYRFELPERFVVDMEVDGPRKDYSTHTVYERSQVARRRRP